MKCDPRAFVLEVVNMDSEFGFSMDHFVEVNDRRG